MSVDAQGSIGWQVGDYFQLIGLVGEKTLGRFPVDFFPLKGLLGGDRFPHQAFDAFQVLWGEGTGNVEIVIKSVLGWGANAHFCFGKQLEHCVGHNVGRRMPHPMSQCLNCIGVEWVLSSMIQHSEILCPVVNVDCLTFKLWPPTGPI